MWGLCMPNFRPLASLVCEENEVTVTRKMSRPIPIQNFLSLSFASRGWDNIYQVGQPKNPFFVVLTILLKGSGFIN